MTTVVRDNRGMRFGILGPVEVVNDGAAVPVGGPTVRALLAMLLLDAGRVVPAERLIDGLYGEAPPSGAANALQSQVSRLRRGLGDAGLVEGCRRGTASPSRGRTSTSTGSRGSPKTRARPWRTAGTRRRRPCSKRRSACGAARRWRT